MPRSIKEIEDKIIGRGLIASEILASEARSRIVKAILDGRNDKTADVVEAVRDIIAVFGQGLSRIFPEAKLAAWVAGAHEVARRLPLVALEGLGTPPPPTVPPAFPPPSDDDSGDLDGPLVDFPIIRGAQDYLESKGVVTRAQFDELDDDAKREAFTIAGDIEVDVIEKVRDILAEEIEEGASLAGFRAKVTEAIGNTAIGPAHLENVYRTNIQTAFAEGHDRLAANDIVGELFPFAEYLPIDDSRTRDEHFELGRLGLDGTGVYWRDDPMWNYFRPPWDYQCRCGINLLTKEQAAARGVRQAQEWIATGSEPAHEHRADLIPFRPTNGFVGPKGLSCSGILRMAGKQAPAGGVTIGGKFYQGGQFIPGDVIDKATAEEKAALEGKGGSGEKKNVHYGFKKKLEELKLNPDAFDNPDELADSLNDVGLNETFAKMGMYPQGGLINLKAVAKKIGFAWDGGHQSWDQMDSAKELWGEPGDPKASNGTEFEGELEGLGWNPAFKTPEDLLDSLKGGGLDVTKEKLGLKNISNEDFDSQLENFGITWDPMEGWGLEEVTTEETPSNDFTKKLEDIGAVAAYSSAQALADDLNKIGTVGVGDKLKIDPNDLLGVTSELGLDYNMEEDTWDVAGTYDETKTSQLPSPPPAPSDPPDPPALPDAPPVPTKNIGPVDKIKTLGGSTGAVLVEDEQGAQYVQKTGATAGHVAEEVTADLMYQAAGISVPPVVDFDGTTKTTAWIHGGKLLNELSGDERKAAEDELRKNFAMDALMANWDVVGQNADNVMVRTTAGGKLKVFRIDNGGSLRYRAQGGAKGNLFGDSVNELSTMRDPKYGTGKIFGKLSDEDVAGQIDELLAKKDAILAATPKDLKAKIQARMDSMKSWSDGVKAKNEQAKVAATAPKGGGDGNKTGLTGGLGVTDSWNKLLSQQAKYKLTDEQLIAVMQKEFPGRTKFQPPSRIRSWYNTGKFGFGTGKPLPAEERLKIFKTQSHDLSNGGPTFADGAAASTPFDSPPPAVPYEKSYPEWKNNILNSTAKIPGGSGSTWKQAKKAILNWKGSSQTFKVCALTPPKCSDPVGFKAWKAALAVAPRYQGKTYRGMSFSSSEKLNGFLDQWDNDGTQFQFKSEASSSKTFGASFAKGSNANAPVDKGKVAMIMNQRSGVEIHTIGGYAGEQEIVMTENSRFKLKAVRAYAADGTEHTAPSVKELRAKLGDANTNQYGWKFEMEEV